jgi:two-component system sensor histidine kinase TctE
MAENPTAAEPSSHLSQKHPSLRSILVWKILLPVALAFLFNAWLVQRDISQLLTHTFDRTLLAAAKDLAEDLIVQTDEVGQASMTVPVPHATFDVMRADPDARVYIQVTDWRGQRMGQDESMPTFGLAPAMPQATPIAEAFRFDDAQLGGRSVRVVSLLSPVQIGQQHAQVLVQVAQSYSVHDKPYHAALMNSLLRQVLLAVLIAGTVLTVAYVAVKKIGKVSAELEQRSPFDLRPLPTDGLSLELANIVNALNRMMGRLDQGQEERKNFVRDASHQLRTPLAVLKLQAQSALRGDVDPTQAVREMHTTVERSIEVVNQMLNLAKVEQVRAEGKRPRVFWDSCVREVALDLAPLLIDKDIDFALEVESVAVRADPWMLTELARNLLSNAIQYCPPGGPLVVRLQAKPESRSGELVVFDSGPGMTPEQQKRLFQPFSSGQQQGGVGLGLTICHAIVKALNGEIVVDSTEPPGRGLLVTVRLPMDAPAAAGDKPYSDDITS